MRAIDGLCLYSLEKLWKVHVFNMLIPREQCQTEKRENKFVFLFLFFFPYNVVTSIRVCLVNDDDDDDESLLCIE